MLGAGVGGQGGFQLFDFGAHDVLPVVQHLLYPRIDRVAQGLVLLLQVDELHGGLKPVGRRRL